MGLVHGYGFFVGVHSLESKILKKTRPRDVFSSKRAHRHPLLGSAIKFRGRIIFLKIDVFGWGWCMVMDFL